MTSSLRIIVTGLIAQHPTLAGVTWDYLQYVLGLHRLGHEVFYFEDSGEWPYNLAGETCDWVARDPSANVQHLASTMARFGLDGRWAYHFPIDDRWFGLPDGKRQEVLRSADLLLNVSGTLMDLDAYQQIPHRAYIDSDPVFTQIKLACRDAEFTKRVHAHTVHFTFGETLDRDFAPASGLVWRPTRSPIVLEEWCAAKPIRDVFTTVMSWTSYKPIGFEGRTYGQKDMEFKTYLRLPELTAPTQFEIAMPAIHHVDWESEQPGGPEGKRLSPSSRLAQHGWNIVNPVEKCGTIDSYRDYLQTSLAEWSVAKNAYVQARCGWFSCRSSCYLAAGRPVVVQDTGFSSVIPTGRGILAFGSLPEAVEGVRELAANPGPHSQAARELATAYFDARRLLPALIEEAMIAETEPTSQEALL